MPFRPCTSTLIDGDASVTLDDLLSVHPSAFVVILKEPVFPCQHPKKVVSDSLGLVNFAIGPVIFILNLPNGQELCFEEIQITEGL